MRQNDVPCQYISIFGFLHRPRCKYKYVCYNSFIFDWLCNCKGGGLSQNTKAVRKKYLFALLQEIDLNIERLREIHGKMPTRAALEEFLKAPVIRIPTPRKVWVRPRHPKIERVVNRPLITFDYDCIIFMSNTEVLQDLEDLLIKSIIQFYGRLETLKSDVGSIENKAFVTISLGGRNDLFIHLKSLMENGITLGENARNGIALYLRKV
jgi:hypothetical protein